MFLNNRKPSFVPFGYLFPLSISISSVRLDFVIEDNVFQEKGIASAFWHSVRSSFAGESANTSRLTISHRDYDDQP